MAEQIRARHGVYSFYYMKLFVQTSILAAFRGHRVVNSVPGTNLRPLRSECQKRRQNLRFPGLTRGYWYLLFHVLLFIWNMRKVVNFEICWESSPVSNRSRCGFSQSTVWWLVC